MCGLRIFAGWQNRVRACEPTSSSPGSITSLGRVLKTVHHFTSNNVSSTRQAAPCHACKFKLQMQCIKFLGLRRCRHGSEPLVIELESSRVFRLELRTGDQVINAELKLFALCRHALFDIVNIYYIICSQNPRARSSPPNQPDRTPPHPLLQPPSLPQPRPHPHHRGRRPRGCRWANTKTCLKNILNSFHMYLCNWFFYLKNVRSVLL